MAQCAYCATETELYESNTPICVSCADLSSERRAVRAKLFHEWSEAVKRADSASEAFSQVTKAVPSGLPHSDGIQRTKNVARQLELARSEMMIAHNRLNDFLERGIVPLELKRSE
jgi:hypothetical protein